MPSEIRMWVRRLILSSLLFAATDCAVADELARASAGLQPAPVTEGVINPSSSVVELVPQVSVINPAGFSLSTDRYVAHYSDTLYGLPAFFVGIATRFAQLGNFELFASAKVGYATKSGGISVTQSAVREVLMPVVTDQVRVTWIPASFGAQALYSIPGFSFLRPGLTVGIGTDLIMQSGHLPGFDHTFLLPFFHVTPQLTFLDGVRGADWFGGIVFGFSYLTTFANSQMLHGTSVDLSLNIVL